MRLYDTFSRSLVELPPPPGPIRMYFCGPTVYQRAHIGNARPFVLGMWLRTWLRHRGYDATLVHNITDVNDSIYEHAPGNSAELRLGRGVTDLSRPIFVGTSNGAGTCILSTDTDPNHGTSASGGSSIRPSATNHATIPSCTTSTSAMSTIK